MSAEDREQVARSAAESEDAAFGRKMLRVALAGAVLFLVVGAVLAARAIAQVRAIAARSESAPPETDAARLLTRSPGGDLVTRAGMAGPSRVVWLGPAHCALGATPSGAWVAVLGLREGTRDARASWMDDRRLELSYARFQKRWVKEVNIVEVALTDALLAQMKGDNACTVPVLRAVVRNVDPVGLEHVPTDSRPMVQGLAPVEPLELRLRGSR